MASDIIERRKASA